MVFDVFFLDSFIVGFLRNPTYCFLDSFCCFSGSDILFLINVDGNTEILWCPQTPPVYPPAILVRKK
jgi:hypothetical protein